MSVSNYTLVSLADATSVNDKNGPGWIPSAAARKVEQYSKAINGSSFTALAGMIILFVGMGILEFTHARVASTIPMGIGGGLFVLGLAGTFGCFYKVMYKKLSNQELLDFIGVNGAKAIEDFNRQIDDYAASEHGKGVDFEKTKQAFADRIAPVWQDLFRSSVTNEQQLHDVL